ncbi:MAG TPA: restriction endonuclease [Candidatus Avimuribaculum pullicola]|nr:restriction endonuclease [Candidatus Avimuribaculum pullicola]
MKIQRTFGWVQNPANSLTLQRVVAIFEPNSDIAKWLLSERIPLLTDNGLLHNVVEWDKYTAMICSGLPIPYSALKGKGCGRGRRADAKCSGIVQAVIDAQKKVEIIVNGEKVAMHKPYTDDWTADGYLRWAISIGFVEYNPEDDTCKISKLGTQFIYSSGTGFKEVLGQAYLSYPPVCRILQLLANGEHLTKFEIGRNLGFTSEAGFTSFPQNIWAQAYQEHPEERAIIRNNYEGSSDKYARMICSWLNEIGWVNISGKQVVEQYGGKSYSCTIAQAYTITALGRSNYKRAIGKSSSARVPKIVFMGMLSTKPVDKDYLRLRRALIIKYTENEYRSLDDIKNYLNSQGLDESTDTIKDDLQGLINIGLNYVLKSGCYKLVDEIKGLVIQSSKCEKGDVSLIKDKIRPYLNNVNQKYLLLVDLSLDGSSNLEFEIQTLDLLTNELNFNGCHLGGSRRPDGIIYYSANGLIIDNKAYSKGYALPRHHIDEMVRYLEENNKRDAGINPNEWWKEFDEGVSHFNFAFISSFFTGQYVPRLQEIKNRTGVNGAVWDVENLLLVAEALKRGSLSYADFFLLFDKNDSINFAIDD